MINNKKSSTTNYWKTNLKYLIILLSIWFIVSFGFGILFVDELNSIRMGGFKLGFWFAQQGSIFVVVILIFVYIKLMNKVDNHYKNLNKTKKSVFPEFYDSNIVKHLKIVKCDKTS